MSGNYRVEIAKQGRAGCSATDCKKEDIKIGKGEIRVGVTVVFKEHTSWKWRHWGCVTPTMLHNWKETTEGDEEMIDGLEEIPEEIQEKVKRAIANEHVDDDDWKGDAEMNRYNPDNKMQGMFVKKSAKSKKKKDDDDEGDDDDAPKKPAPKKRGRKAAHEYDDDDDAEEAPVPKKARGRKVKPEDDETAETPAPKKPRGKKAKAEDAADAEIAAPAPVKRSGKQPKGSKPTGASNDAESEPAEEPKAAPKKARGKKAAASAPPDASDDIDGPDEPAPKAATKRKGKSKKAAAVAEDDE